MITTLSILGSALGMTCSVLLALRMLRLVYPLGAVTAGVFIALNLTLAVRDDQAAVAWLVLPGAWSIIWNLIGMMRLRHPRIRD
jgi:hypothetical protein